MKFQKGRFVGGPTLKVKKSNLVKLDHSEAMLIEMDYLGTEMKILNLEIRK